MFCRSHCSLDVACAVSLCRGEVYWAKCKSAEVVGEKSEVLLALCLAWNVTCSLRDTYASTRSFR